MQAIKWIRVNDLRSDRGAKNERPVGVPAARGHGVMEVMTFEALGGGLERIDRVPAVFAAVDSPDGSFSPGTFVPSLGFALVSLQPPLLRAID